MESLVCDKTIVRVSSVLNHDKMQFGKSHMFDGKEDTCWNSDEGSPQFVSLEFPAPVSPAEVQLQFHGGFSGQSCRLEAESDDADWTDVMKFYPQDSSSLQIFPVNGTCVNARRLKIVFETSSDFFGRVTIYMLNIVGKRELNQKDSVIHTSS